MENKTITVSVKMDKKILRSFSLFDTFILRGAIKKPALFAFLMTVFACVCLFGTQREGHLLLGFVLLGVGLVLPAAYVGMFTLQVHDKAKALRLNPPRRVYTLVFSKDHIHITNNMKQEEDVRLEWQKTGAAFRLKKAIYLYATPTRAFILPEGQADASTDELWQMIVDNLPKGRAYDKRRGK